MCQVSVSGMQVSGVSDLALAWLGDLAESRRSTSGQAGRVDCCLGSLPHPSSSFTVFRSRLRRAPTPLLGSLLHSREGSVSDLPPSPSLLVVRPSIDDRYHTRPLTRKRAFIRLAISFCEKKVRPFPKGSPPTLRARTHATKTKVTDAQPRRRNNEAGGTKHNS